MCTAWIVEAFSHLHETVPDGINYLDIAAACAKGDWSAAINGYWSPGYPVLLSLFFRMMEPSPWWEMILVHAADCLFLVLALICFEGFLNALLRYLHQASRRDPDLRLLPVWSLRAVGYALFFWATVFMTPASLDTPDAFVLAFVLLAATILLQIAAGEDGWLRFAVLGIVLGLAYLAKAVMFPLAFVFLAATLFTGLQLRRAVPRLATAFIFFLLVSSPFLLLLSRSKGRLTFGDAGAIAYAEYVDGVPVFDHWQGGLPGSGTPLHPTRKILDVPPVYEFATPVHGSYPVGADLSYWYAGVRPHFVIGGQLSVLRHTLDEDFNLLFVRQAGFVVGFLVLAVCASSPGRLTRRLLKEIFLWGPPVIALGAYALVYTEDRYVAPFLILIWMGLLVSIPLDVSSVVHFLVRAVTLAVVTILSVQIAWSMIHSLARLPSARSFTQWSVAQELQREGVAPGGKVAVINMDAWNLYWAHLASVTIVAEVPLDSVSSFWLADSTQKNDALRAFARAGARAIVARDVPPTLSASGWQHISGTGFYVLRLKQ